MRYVVAYDVTDDDVRERLARRIEHHGVRIQFSVFDCELDDRDDLDEFVDDMGNIVAGEAASVAVVMQCANCLDARRWIGPPPEIMDALVYIV